MPPDLESSLAIIAMLALLKTTGLLLLLHQTKLCRSRLFLLRVQLYRTGPAKTALVISSDAYQR
jgi:hypothetical protein